MASQSKNSLSQFSQEIEIVVNLTANHFGRFEIFLCPNNKPRYEATQDCFDKYPLMVSGSQSVKFEISHDTEKKQDFIYTVRLPRGVTCTQCVIQWTYYTGNMWGTCDNGTEGLGCGRPETFRNCADVSIISNVGGGIPPAAVDKDKHKNNPFLLYYKDLRADPGNDVFPLIVK